MAVLHWDLQEHATRDSLLTQTRAVLGEERSVAIAAAADSAGVPDKHHHDIVEVLETIASLRVSEEVKCHLREIYGILAEAEATAHNCEVEETHFHEVGNGNGIRNVVEICLAIESASPDCILASAAQAGQGTVHCAHGQLSIPAPATRAIIARGIPVCPHKLPGERMTPTSAAVILHYVDKFE